MRRTVLLVLAVVVLASGCAGARTSASQQMTVGFIFVGARDDLGYNQAAWEGSEALARSMPDLRILRVENVPEDHAAVTAMEGLIRRGATILFATSFGHLEAAYEVARRNPEVTVLHQGGVEPSPRLDNFGTYFGTHSEALYLAGVAAGAATRSNRLGFVAAFPIPATFNNVNAFTLGAQSVDPAATTQVIFTKDWCQPEAQAAAAAALIAAQVDVIAQHQDCTRTILQAAEAAGIYSVGYHSDGSEVAPKGWLIGAVWVWDRLFEDIVHTILDGRFSTSPYNGDFRGSLAHGDNPFVLTEPGPTVSPATRARLDATLDSLRSGESPFKGPVVDRDGVVRVAAGSSLSPAGLDTMDWFVAGVTGDVPAPAR